MKPKTPLQNMQLMDLIQRKCNNFSKRYITINVLILALSFIIFSIFKYAPVDHKNKALQKDEFIIAKKKSRLIGIVVVGFWE